MPTHKQQHDLAVQKWTAMYEAGELVTNPVEITDLPDSTRDFLWLLVRPTGLEIRLGPTIGEQHLIQVIGDDVVGWLAHCSRCHSHTWGAPDFGDVENNAVLARFAKLSGVYAGDEETTHALFDMMDKVMIEGDVERN